MSDTKIPGLRLKTEYEVWRLRDQIGWVKYGVRETIEEAIQSLDRLKTYYGDNPTRIVQVTRTVVDESEAKP